MTDAVEVLENQENSLDFAHVFPMILEYTRDALVIVKEMYGHEAYQITPDNIIGLGREHYFILTVYGLPLIQRLMVDYLGEEEVKTMTTDLVTSLLQEMIDEFSFPPSFF